LGIDDAIAVLDAAGADRAAVVGYSLGARVAYAMAIRCPDRVTAVVGLDSIPEPDLDPFRTRQGAERVLREGTASAISHMSGLEPEPAPGWLLEHLESVPARAGAFLGRRSYLPRLGEARFPREDVLARRAGNYVVTR